ncbi:17156_t:CDS:2 [Dentiscutata heterogama]|uniref:17156_t:CDS:1 n=1 Tax=Dentiscutata heterogama TaxID=1316150 RepID=A0ACA9JZ77_9GLOM|nr:17156_t:CDS:2 [Dentiscutata heterogama]
MLKNRDKADKISNKNNNNCINIQQRVEQTQEEIIVYINPLSVANIIPRWVHLGV